MTVAVTAAEILVAMLAVLAGVRGVARMRRRYVRLMIEPYRGDRTRPDALLASVAGLHALVAARGPRRLLTGQPSFALEIHLHIRAGGAPLAWFGISAPRGLERQVQAALRASYPNSALRAVAVGLSAGGGMIRLHKRLLYSEPVRRLAEVDPDHPPVERLLLAMAASGGPAVVQLALTPAPAVLGRPAGRAAGDRAGPAGPGDARGGVPGWGSPVRSSPRASAGSPPGGSSRPAGPYFYGDIRVIGRDPRDLGAVGAELRAGGRPNRLIARRVGSGRRWAYRRRVARGEGNPVPAPLRRTYAAEEIAALWQLPSVGFGALPHRRRATPVAPAPAGIMRVSAPAGLVADDHGPVTIHPELRRQNTAVVGTVEQGKTSYLVATVREDLRRDDCAVIVLDPKGDAADAALSAVPAGRTCTLLDLGRPTCGFNPLASRAPADAVADFVVAALRQLFDEGEIRGSSDRYLRNAVIAVLAFDRRATLWDVARLLGVGASGVALRARVAHRLAELPEFAEVASFLAEELPEQLAAARASTTAKLDAPANKLARILNSTSVKRVLLNDSAVVDFDRLIDRREVLVVRGALGEVGAGNVSVLMQLLVGMLDAALARAQDRRTRERPTAVALKIDEAPLVINPAFAQTLALKRSAGLETVACWQTDAQWPPELREQLDALFAHRVLFATASAEDARAAAGLLMAEFSDQLRSGDSALASLAAPDVRLHLPRHTAIVSWTTPTGRERPFIGRTLPLVVDPDRIAGHAERQLARGARELADLLPPPGLEAAGPEAGEAPADGRSEVSALLAGAVAGEAPGDAVSGVPELGSAPVVGVGGGETPASYAELEALDAATRVRWLPVAPAAARPALDGFEVELLAWITAARCALSSQAHRRLSPGRALSTTQRRLKRLADLGLLGRFQLHGGDGGGVPFCCAATPAALELLGIDGRRAPELADDGLDSLRCDVHTVGWLLALEAHARGALVSVLGPGRARLAPARDPAGGPVSIDLGPGCHARDFLTGDPAGPPRQTVERFLPLTPAAVAEIRAAPGPSARTTDLLILPAPADRSRALTLLERCDHLIAGWWSLVPRYARLGGPPTAVVLCRDREQAVAVAGIADDVLVACHARIGQPPADWAYPGREGVVMAVERDLHDGRLVGYRVPRVVAAARPAGAGGLRYEPIADLVADPSAGDRTTWR